MRLAALVVAGSLAAAPLARAGGGGLDWEVQEDRQAPAPVLAARNVRDGLLGVADAFLDANTGLFGELALLLGQVGMAASDLLGLLDDNPVSEHVTRGLLSKTFAKTAYLWHLAGSEALLGGHGLEKERWVARDVAGLNPLLAPQDVDEVAGPLPLDPLDFVGEGWVHTEVYRTHLLPLGLGALVAADGLLRPASGVLRIAQLPGSADALDRRACDLVRRAARVRW